MSDGERDGEGDDEVAWLLARERGQPLPPLSEARASRYGRLESLISELAALPPAPSPGLHQRMLAALDAAAAAEASELPVITSAGAAAAAGQASERLALDAMGAARARPRRRWVAQTAAAAVVIIALVWFLWPGPPPPQIAFAVEHAPGRLDADRPGIGDKIIVTAVVAPGGELRVYDDDGAEQARCAAPGPGCTVVRTGDHATLVLTMTVQKDSLFRAFAFSASPGAPSAGLAGDIAAAEHAGIQVLQRELRENH